MAGAVRIAILADAGQATSELRNVANAVNDTETRLDAAGRAAGKWADKADLMGGAAAKAAGGLGDVASGLAANGVISDEAAAKADQVAKGMMIVAGAADIATTAGALYAAAQEAGGLAAAKNAVATVASKVATVASTAVTGVATAAQWAWNAAMAANPIGLVVLAVVALVAGLVLLWKHSETFRRIVTASWEAVKNAAVAVFNFLVNYIKGVFNLYAKIFNLGKDIARGIADGIAAGIKWVKDKVAGLGKLIPEWLRKVLGIRSPSRVMHAIGKQAMAGLTGGIAAEIPALKRTLGTVSGTLTGLDTSLSAGSTDIASGAGGRLGSTGGVTINVTVAPGADPAEVGRQTVKAIEAFQRRTGRRVLATT